MNQRRMIQRLGLWLLRMPGPRLRQLLLAKPLPVRLWLLRQLLLLSLRYFRTL
jgi:hypothetical protein